ncbi:insertion element IS1 4 protein InsB [Escherichia coli H383]|nr:insertion element IS1 4 protein InsB [Escherichia coli H383]
MPGNCPHYGRWPQHDFPPFKKLRPQSVTSRIQPGSDVIVCAEMDEQWGYVGAKSRQRWLFYAYDRLRKTVVAHVFGERTMATLGRLMSLLSPFDVVILKWFTEFGHLNRGDMLTSEQHRSHNEKKKFQRRV